MEEDSSYRDHQSPYNSLYSHENDSSPFWDEDSAWSHNPHYPMKPAFSGMNGSPPRPPPLHYSQLDTATGEEDYGSEQGSYFSLQPPPTTATAAATTTASAADAQGDRRVVHGYRTPVTYRENDPPEIGKEDVQGFHHRTNLHQQKLQDSSNHQANGKQSKSTGSRRHSLEDTPENHTTDSRESGNLERFGQRYVGSEVLKKAAQTLKSLQSSKRRQQQQENPSDGSFSHQDDDVYKGVSDKIDEIQRRRRHSQEKNEQGAEPHAATWSPAGKVTRDSIGEAQSTTQQNLNQAMVNNAIDYLYHSSTAPPPPPPPPPLSTTQTPTAKHTEDTKPHGSGESSKSKRLQRPSSFRSSTSSSRSKSKRRTATSDHTHSNQASPSKVNPLFSGEFSKHHTPASSSTGAGRLEISSRRKNEDIQSDDMDDEEQTVRHSKQLEEAFQKRLDEELRKQKVHLQYHFEQKILQMEKQLLAIQKSKNEAKRRAAEAVHPSVEQLVHDTGCLRVSIAPSLTAEDPSIRRLRTLYQQRNKKLSKQVETLEEKLRSVEAERDELRVTLAASQKVSPSGKQGRGKGSEGGGSKENKFDAKNKRQVSQKSEILERDRLIQQLRDEIQEEREKFNTFERQFQSKFNSHCRAFETKLRGKASAAIATVRHTAEVAARQHYNQQLEKIEKQLREQGVEVESLPMSLTPLPMPHHHKNHSEATFEPPVDPAAMEEESSMSQRNGSDHSGAPAGGFQVDSSKEGSLVEAAIPEIVLGESLARASANDIYSEVMNSVVSSTPTYTNAADGQPTFSYDRNYHNRDAVDNPQISREDQAHLDRMLVSDELRKEQSSKMMQRFRDARKKTKSGLRKGQR